MVEAGAKEIEDEEMIGAILFGHEEIKKQCAFIEEIWADLMLNGKINPASGIFLSKNWFDYKDVADVVVTPNNPLQNLDEEAARKRIIEALPEPDETD